MNWVGGRLNHATNKKANTALTVQQRRYFAKSRATVECLHKNKPSFDLSFCRAEDSEVKSVEVRGPSPANFGLREPESHHSKNEVPERPSSLRARLLENRDWIGSAPVKPLDYHFPNQRNREHLAKRRRIQRNGLSDRVRQNSTREPEKTAISISPDSTSMRGQHKGAFQQRPKNSERNTEAISAEVHGEPREARFNTYDPSDQNRASQLFPMRTPGLTREQIAAYEVSRSYSADSKTESAARLGLGVSDDDDDMLNTPSVADPARKLEVLSSISETPQMSFFGDSEINPVPLDEVNQSVRQANRDTVAVKPDHAIEYLDPIVLETTKWTAPGVTENRQSFTFFTEDADLWTTENDPPELQEDDVSWDSWMPFETTSDDDMVGNRPTPQHNLHNRKRVDIDHSDPGPEREHSDLPIQFPDKYDDWHGSRIQDSNEEETSKTLVLSTKSSYDADDRPNNSWCNPPDTEDSRDKAWMSFVFGSHTASNTERSEMSLIDRAPRW